MGKISVVIQTYNAEKHLRRVLESVKDFDEVVVVDMESTDGTQAIAREAGARVVEVPRGDYNICEVYRQRAVDEASNPWVLVVDADEVITPELREYLYRRIDEDPTPRGFRIPVKNFFMGRWMRCYYPNYVMRMVPRGLTTWAPVIHAQPVVDGGTETVPAHPDNLAIVHLDNPDMQRTIAKMNQYTGNEVSRREGRFNVWQFFYKPPYSFFKTYVLKRGFRDGMPGFIHAVLDAHYTFVVLAKIYEKKKGKGEV